MFLNFIRSIASYPSIYIGRIVQTRRPRTLFLRRALIGSFTEEKQRGFAGGEMSDSVHRKASQWLGYDQARTNEYSAVPETTLNRYVRSGSLCSRKSLDSHFTTFRKSSI